MLYHLHEGNALEILIKVATFENSTFKTKAASSRGKMSSTSLSIGAWATCD